MQLRRKKVLIFVVLFVIPCTNLFAQVNWDELSTLYQSQKFAQIKTLLSQISPQDTTQLPYVFFKSIFIKDGEKARQNYEYVYTKAHGKLKQFAARRLHDYYYAKGLYIQANKYANAPAGAEKNDLQVSKQIFIEESPYKIQVGAFSKRENALHELNILKGQNIRARVVKRRINNRDFYCVWVDALKNIEETRKYAEQIKKQFNLNYRIIKP